MGSEIDHREFTESEFRAFRERLRLETRLLRDSLDAGEISSDHGRCGLELEAWLVDGDFQPAPSNQRFLERLDNPLVVPELARFNFEINADPHALSPTLLRDVQRALDGIWRDCSQGAGDLGLKVLQIGILPTLRNAALSMNNVSDLNRYQALNAQILARRRGRPLSIDISGDHDRLQLLHTDVMAEAATTSLQIHLQLDPRRGARFYNAAQILAAPLVAACANSPFLFQKKLWEETRIPMFEQAVSPTDVTDRCGQPLGRVCFGNRYVQHSLLEQFEENLDVFPVLLPALSDSPPQRFKHLRLHNGTIWRWNRALVGFDDQQRPHLRLEHRAIPAGPSVPDVTANIALFYGLIHDLAAREPAPETLLPFSHTKANFYRTARHGMETTLHWLDGQEHNARDLLLQELLPSAHKSLLALGLCRDDVDFYIDEVMGSRVRSKQTGAGWQRAFIRQHGPFFRAMTEQYHANQQQQLPVYRWTV